MIDILQHFLIAIQANSFGIACLGEASHAA
jgi:hypothetical protein